MTFKIPLIGRRLTVALWKIPKKRKLVLKLPSEKQIDAIDPFKMKTGKGEIDEKMPFAEPFKLAPKNAFKPFPKLVESTGEGVTRDY